MMKFHKYRQSLPSPDVALPGRATSVHLSNNHAVLDKPLVEPYPSDTEVAYFGMGCFWGAEKLFWSVKGVYCTAVGYGAGFTPNPTYEEVCSGMTGHNEIVKVIYWPNEISYSCLMKIFWENHNPCQGMRQGNDVGTQYRSGIYVTTSEQQRQAEQAKAAYDGVLSDRGLDASTTEIISTFKFYYAEAYHQQYLAKNPLGYCPNHGCDATGLPRLPMSQANVMFL